MKIILILMTLVSCSITPKTKNAGAGKLVKQKKLDFPKPANWADEFYQKTEFRLVDPKVMNSYKQILDICKSSEFSFLTGYRATEPHPIKFKKEQITITTATGFSKKAYVSKGVCRELSLFKAPKTAKDGQIRTNIKELNIIYIYNFGSYVKDITFRTAYKDVFFYVE